MMKCRSRLALCLHVARGLAVGAGAALGIALFAAANHEVRAAPEPEAVPRRWELKLDAGPLRVLTAEVKDKGRRTFFAFTYEVTNNSGQDIYFAPNFELVTDKGEMLRSGRGVPREVIDEILASLGNPELLDEIRIQDNLLQGPENARSGLVVWPCNDLKCDEVTIYAAGFSGESKTVRRPDNGEEVVLRKTRMLRHIVRGELDAASWQELERTEDRWILR